MQIGFAILKTPVPIACWIFVLTINDESLSSFSEKPEKNEPDIMMIKSSSKVTRENQIIKSRCAISVLLHYSSGQTSLGG